MPNDYILTSDGNFISAQELMHGRNIRYIDLDEDEMMHWKYIKREKLPNGKYRYYYDESEFKKYENMVNTARSMRAKASWGVVNAKNEYSKTSAARQSAWYKNAAAKGVADKVSTFQEWSKAVGADMAAEKKLSQAKKHSDYTDDLVKRATKKYETKKITSFPERAISKGIVTVMNWLSGTSKSDKGKKSGSLVGHNTTISGLTDNDWKRVLNNKTKNRRNSR